MRGRTYVSGQFPLRSHPSISYSQPILKKLTNIRGLPDIDCKVRLGPYHSVSFRAHIQMTSKIANLDRSIFRDVPDATPGYAMLPLLL